MIEIDYDKVKMKHYLYVQLDKEKLDIEYALYELLHIFKEKAYKKSKTIKQLIWDGYSYKTEKHSTQEIFDMMESKGWVETEIKRGRTYYSILDHPWK